MASIDINSFSIAGDGKKINKTESGIAPQWWTLDGDQVADSISAVLTRMRDNQTLRHTQWVISARLYGNLAPTSLAGVSFSKLAATQPALRDRVSYNVIQSVVDAITSKIAKNRPKPLFLTNGGNYRQQRRAKGLNQFCDGVFYENSTHQLGIKVFRDAAVWGDGFIHVFNDGGRVRHERVLPSEIFVDDVEALYGHPRQMHRVKLVDRQVLMKAFPDYKDVIQSASTARMEDTSRGNVADVLLVRESWHLPSSADAKDGKHCISIDGHLLSDIEPWEHNWFPFARMQWTPRLFGFWGQGLAEQLMNIQLEINKLLWSIQRSFHLAGTFKVLVENGSKIVREHLNNDVGSIINYTGAPPSYVLPPTVQPEVFSHLNMLINRAYEQAGISQLSASSAKPAGLDSGKALREYNDIESDRFTIVGRQFENLFLDVAKLSIETIKQIDNAGEYSVSVPGRNEISMIKWKDVNLQDEEYIMQCFPVSSLPNDPAGRLQTVQEYAQAGFLSPRQARRLLDFPDIEQVENLANSAENYLVSVLDKIVDKGIYTPPDPFDDLQMARELAIEYYTQGKNTGLEQKKLKMLRTFISQIQSIEDEMNAAPPGQEGMMPPGMPMPPGMEAAAGMMPPPAMPPPPGMPPAPQGATPDLQSLLASMGGQ